MHVRDSIGVTDDHSRTRGRSQITDHRVYRVKKEETRLDASVYFDASLIVHLVFLAFYFTFLPLSPFLPYPFYSLCTYSLHNLNLGGRLFSQYLVYRYLTHTIPVPRCRFSLVLVYLISSRLVSHIDINSRHRPSPSSFIYRSGTDSFPSHLFTASPRSHKSWMPYRLHSSTFAARSPYLDCETHIISTLTSTTYLDKMPMDTQDEGVFGYATSTSASTSMSPGEIRNCFCGNVIGNGEGIYCSAGTSCRVHLPLLDPSRLTPYHMLVAGIVVYPFIPTAAYPLPPPLKPY